MLTSLRITIDEKLVEVGIYIDTAAGTFTLKSEKGDITVNLMKIFGNSQGFGQALSDLALLYKESTAVGAVGNGAQTIVKPNKHVKPL